jgi:hypothetical protein
VLIKVVPNPILIFYLSFLKMLVCVEEDCVYSESLFVLCGWVGGGSRCINWMRWIVVCQTRSKGGLGVRDVNLVILSLLAN